MLFEVSVVLDALELGFEGQHLALQAAQQVALFIHFKY